jgi:hypothetical protein
VIIQPWCFLKWEEEEGAGGVKTGLLLPGDLFFGQITRHTVVMFKNPHLGETYSRVLGASDCQCQSSNSVDDAA